MVKRNETRGADQISESLKSRLLGKESSEPQVSRLTAVCDVCGYGYYCPVMGMEMSSDARSVTLSDRCDGVVNVMKGYDEHDCRVDDALQMWLRSADTRTVHGNEVYLKEGGRGRLLKCLCCEVCVHTNCMDLERVMVIHSDDQFDCRRGSVASELDYICPSCLCGIGPFSCQIASFMDYASSTISLSYYCPICGCSSGYRVLSSEGVWVHKRCALLIASSMYNTRHSRFFPQTTAEYAVRTLVEFVLPSSECMGVVNNEMWGREGRVRGRYSTMVVGKNGGKVITCAECKENTGRFVKCSVPGCQQVVFACAFP